MPGAFPSFVGSELYPEQVFPSGRLNSTVFPTFSSYNLWQFYIKLKDMTKEEYFEQAVNAFGDEKLDEAIEAYKKALEMDPSYQDSLHGLLMALFNRGSVGEAMAAARRRIEFV